MQNAIGVTDGASMKLATVTSAKPAEPCLDLDRLQPLKLDLAEHRSDLPLDNVEILLARPRRQILPIEPLSEIALDRELRGIGQDALVGGIEQPGELGLGVLPGAFNRHVSDPALAGYCIRLAVEFEPPRMFAASGDVASHFGDLKGNPARISSLVAASLKIWPKEFK